MVADLNGDAITEVVYWINLAGGTAVGVKEALPIRLPSMAW
ncbi:hypothetical protein [Paenibacillus sp. FSL P4-0081]|nr:hypothetical protein [Paenibacillus sp. FSL P4-0081]